ncbi:MAG: AMP-binding protein [Anaerolineae bacterium]
MIPKASGTVTVGNLLKVASFRYRDREAIYCSSTGRRFTFAQLNARTNRLANGLLRLGLKKGDVAAFLCTNRAEVVEMYFALAKTGIVGVPLNYRLAPAEMIQLMADFGVRALLYEDRFGPIAEAARARMPQLRAFISIGNNLAPFATNYEKFLADSPEAEPVVEVVEEDDYYMNLTSGTTGLPKSYILTQYNNALTVAIFPVLFDLTIDDVALTVFPMFGRVGFAWIGATIYVGAKNVLYNFDPKGVLGLIESEKVSITNWVPTMASMVMANADAGQHDLSSLRAIVFAGSPLPASVREKAKKTLCPRIYEYYGMQETAVLTMAKPAEKERKPDSVGQVVHFADVRVIGADGKDLPTGEIGEVIGRAPGATASYYRDEKKSAITFRNGWVHTGDLGKFDEEGFLYLSGRIKDMIITGGQNVFSTEVESLLMSHPAVADCTVIGLPDPLWGEAVTAVVIKAPGAEVTEEELLQFCKARIAGFKTPKKVIWSDAPLPRTATGKVTKFVLVEKYSHEA